MLFTLILSFCMSAPIPRGDVQAGMPQPGQLGDMPQPGQLGDMPQPGQQAGMPQLGQLPPDQQRQAPGQKPSCEECNKEEDEYFKEYCLRECVPLK
jgi:hypothetical protein